MTSTRCGACSGTPTNVTGFATNSETLNMLRLTPRQACWIAIRRHLFGIIAVADIYFGVPHAKNQPAETKEP